VTRIVLMLFRPFGPGALPAGVPFTGRTGGAPECDAARRRTRPACPNRRPVALARLRAGPCRAAPWGAPRGTGGGAVRARRGEARRRARAVVTAAGPVRWASAGSLVQIGRASGRERVSVCGGAV